MVQPTRGSDLARARGPQAPRPGPGRTVLFELQQVEGEQRLLIEAQYRGKAASGEYRRAQFHDATGVFDYGIRDRQPEAGAGRRRHAALERTYQLVKDFRPNAGAIVDDR